MIDDDTRLRLSRIATVVSAGVWRRAARVASRGVALRAAPVMPVGRVLVVAPHPDDETVGCGGTIAAHVAAGDEVTIVVVTDGGASKALGLAPAETAEVRRAELAAAAEVLGARVVHLGFADGAIDEAVVAQRLRETIGRVRPARIYAPSVVDLHPDHLATARALGRANDDVEVFAYQTYVPFTPVLATHAFDVTAHRARIDAAYAAHASQAATIARFRRLRRYDAALVGIDGDVEVFLALDAVAYRAMPTPDERWRAPRRSALLDPVAYVAGYRARRRIRPKLR